MMIRNLLVVIGEGRFTVSPGLDRLISKSLLPGASLYPQMERKSIQTVFLHCPGNQPQPGQRWEREDTLTGWLHAARQAHFPVPSKIIDGTGVQPGFHIRTVSVLEKPIFFQNYS